MTTTFGVVTDHMGVKAFASFETDRTGSVQITLGEPGPGLECPIDLLDGATLYVGSTHADDPAEVVAVRPYLLPEPSNPNPKEKKRG